MKTFATTALASILVAALSIGAMGQKPPPATPKMKVAMMKSMNCPVCKMPLSMKKTKEMPVAVRMTKGGHVMYCCAGCKMPAKWHAKS